MVSKGGTVAAVVGAMLSALVAVPLRAACVGDCNGDGFVSWRELVLAGDRAVGKARNCPAADANSDGQVYVEEVVLAASNMRSSCVGAATRTNTPTTTPTRSPTPESPGPVITHFGLVSASNRLLDPVDSQDGVAVYQHPAGLGVGFFIVAEAKAGSSGQFPGTIEFTGDFGARPDFQILSNRDLGFGAGLGSAAVCDTTTPNAGGVPGFDPPEFDPSSQAITDALNDFGCRFANNTFDPCILGDDDNPTFARTASTVQFCTAGTVSRTMEFPKGDTMLVLQWRDTGEPPNIGSPQRIIVRVP